MTSQARVEFDPRSFGLRVAIMRDYGDRHELLQWPTPPTVKTYTPGDAALAVNQPADWLQLQDDDARALYEALADFFGHTGNDVRALRRDYDREKERVDKFILFLTEQSHGPRSTVRARTV